VKRPPGEQVAGRSGAAYNRAAAAGMARAATEDLDGGDGMAIPVQCASCGAEFRAKDEHAGRRGKCPKCQTAIQVPGAGAKPQPAAAAKRQAEPAAKPQAAPAAKPAAAEILGAFQGEIEPARVPARYKLGILLVSVVMVVLPLIYVGLILLVGYGVYWHAVHHTGIIEAAPAGRAKGFAVMIYLAPMAVGPILLLFMIKPLFARPAKVERRRSLSRDGEPLLFALVDRVCAAVRAPRPKRIDVDCEVNASAGFRRGILSMFGNDLVLTIGMPLVAGLSLRQFAGVLAHEFGHFTQGAGMRLTYLIRTISMWFTRVVYERDEWDERLRHWAEQADIRIGWVLYVALVFVWVTRRILWVLMMVGHAVAGFMLRQMEFAADRCEARLAGSDTFEQTARRLVLLNVATQGAHADLGEFFREGRLGDNLPKLVMANVTQIPGEVLQKIDGMIDESTTGLLDTHPCDRDRIAAARRENAPGIFRHEAPATVLFRDFDALARNVTWDFYRGVLGPQVKPGDLHPVDELLARQGKEIEAGEALGRYFQGAFSALRPLPLPAWEAAAPQNARETTDRMKQARQEMLARKAEYQAAYRAYDEADTHTVEADQAGALLKASFKIEPSAFSQRLVNQGAVASARGTALAHQQQLVGTMEPFERAAGVRLLAACQLLCVPQVAAKVDGAAAWQQEVERLLPALRALCSGLPAMLELRNSHAALAVLLSNLEGNEQNADLIKAIRSQMSTLFDKLAAVRGELSSVAYPFDHAKGQISVGEYALGEMPTRDDLGGVFGAGEEMLDKLPSVYGRMVARLAAIAEQVESAVGLKPLPKPEQPEVTAIAE